MPTINRTVGLTSTTYTITEGGQPLGSYSQDHGADTVTCDHLGAANGDAQNAAGPLDAIVAIMGAHNLIGALSTGEVSYGMGLRAEISNRVEAVGGLPKVYVTHMIAWANDLQVNPSDVAAILEDHHQPAPAAA